jgi:hypothetical protein
MTRRRRRIRDHFPRRPAQINRPPEQAEPLAATTPRRRKVSRSLARLRPPQVRRLRARSRRARPVPEREDSSIKFTWDLSPEASWFSLACSVLGLTFVGYAWIFPVTTGWGVVWLAVWAILVAVVASSIVEKLSSPDG